MTTPASFDDLDGGPRHEDELLTAHVGRPTPAKHIRNGAAAPPDPGSGDDYAL